MDPDETPTPPAWFASAVLRDEARAVADRLDHVALLSRKRIDFLDYARASSAEEMAKQLRELAQAFNRWEVLEPELVALQREELLDELTIVLGAALKLLEATPSVGALGPARRHR